MRLVSADDVRAAVASHVLGDAGRASMGHVTLHPHQRDAVRRLRRIIAGYGGALLADDVGLGKTYTALAVADGEERVCVIAPAVLRDHWLACARTAGVAIHFHSMEQLSRKRLPHPAPSFVIVDEAHHFRNRGTQRFEGVTRICARARVLLLSATPVHNRAADLRAILSLFLGARADALTDAEAARYVVRRVADDVAASAPLPVVRPAQWLPPCNDVDCLDLILALPPPLPAAGAGDGGVLVTYTLVRQWASSRAALSAGLRRRLARGLAMADALRAGRLPDRRELAAWCLAEDAQQLFFPELVAGVPSATGPLVEQVERHVNGVRALLHWIDAAPNADVERARVLRDLLRQHPGERVVAFSEFADTVRALFRLLAPTTRVAMLTHAGGRLASGVISRAEILQRFATGSSARVPARERIDLLLSTDVLSEGVNLPDASVVVHLDLSWNPARLAQRVGRLRRIDSRHGSVAVYLVPPPAPAERMLQVERRLRDKQAIALRTLGHGDAVLPSGEAKAEDASGVTTSERIAAILDDWLQRGSLDSSFDEPIAAAVRSGESAAIACLSVDGVATLVAMTDAVVTDDARVVLRLCAAAGGSDASIPEGQFRSTLERLQRHLAERRVGGVVEHTSLHVARSRRAVLHRADAIARRATRAMRPRVAPMVHAARMAATATLAAGAERELEELATAGLPDDAWLAAVRDFADRNRRTTASPAEILAILVLCAG